MQKNIVSKETLKEVLIFIGGFVLIYVFSMAVGYGLYGVMKLLGTA